VSLKHLQVLVPQLYGPIYKGIFSDICFLFFASNFTMMIDSTQVAWPLLSITYGLLCPFSRVRREECTYASHLSALRQGFPIQIIPLMSKFSRFVLRHV
jgi:hypothetical protein